MWHHSPAHLLGESGAYMVTAGTYRKQPIFGSEKRRDLVQSKLFEWADQLGWELQAWAVMPNHYHFIAVPRQRPNSLIALIRNLHAQTALAVNQMDRTSRRKVWFQYWDTHLSFQTSYFARLNYVHNNPVHHGLVKTASAYPWCSARWFEENARPSFCRMIASFGHDRISVPDDF